MRYFDFIGAVDVAPLQYELSQHPELWNQHKARKEAPGTPHSRMSDIWVRYNDDTEPRKTGDWSKFNDEHNPIWYPAFDTLPSLRPIIFNLMRQVEGERLGGVLITRIPPGQGIAPHADRGWHVEFYDKYYIAIQNDSGAGFHCGDEVLRPVPGSIWRFDNRLEHWVSNESPFDRITLIVCIRSRHRAAAPGN